VIRQWLHIIRQLAQQLHEGCIAVDEGGRSTMALTSPAERRASTRNIAAHAVPTTMDSSPMVTRPAQIVRCRSGHSPAAARRLHHVPGDQRLPCAWTQREAAAEAGSDRRCPEPMHEKDRVRLGSRLMKPRRARLERLIVFNLAFIRCSFDASAVVASFRHSDADGSGCHVQPIVVRYILGSLPGAAAATRKSRNKAYRRHDARPARRHRVMRSRKAL
jgi:hypothetical protein